MNAPEMGRPVEILLVEDNSGDVFLTQIALEKAKIRNQLHVVVDGEEAIAFLYRRGDYVNVPRPDLILLDLNLPEKDGREVLKEIKSDPAIAPIPVAIFIPSIADRDFIENQGLQANHYIYKPLDFEQLVRVVKSIDNFWFTIVTLPLE